MRTPRSLPDGAAERLSAMLKQAKNKAEYQRIQCVWQRAALSLSASQIATALDWQVGSVPQVHSDYLRHGAAALWRKALGGRHRQNLSPEQEEDLLTPFLEQAAAGGVLVVAPVQAAQEAAVGRPVPPSVVYGALHRQGRRKLMPRPKHPKGNEEAREAFKKLTRAHPSNRGPSRLLWRTIGLPGRVLFQDEARLGRISGPTTMLGTVQRAAGSQCASHPGV